MKKKKKNKEKKKKKSFLGESNPGPCDCRARTLSLDHLDNLNNISIYIYIVGRQQSTKFQVISSSIYLQKSS